MDETTADPAAPASHAEGNTPVAVRDDEAIEDPSVKTDIDAPTTILPPPPGNSSSSSSWQSWTDRALFFLSHASNETLGACLAGLGATTYLVLGRVGLVIIGVVGGVMLHATWEGIRGDDRDEATKRADQERQRETAVDVARRVLEWRRNEQADDQAENTKVYANQALDYSKFGPETSAALNTFTDAVIKDYVHYWYDATIPGEQSFPAACRRTFTAFVLSLAGHLERKRPADVFLDFVGNASSMLIVFLTELSAALNASPNKPAEEAVSAYLEFKPDSSLSAMLNQDSQKSKMADAAEDVLQSYLDPKSYNCSPVHIFLKEVFAQLVLGSTVEMCSKPEWINDWIVYGLEESETTKEVMDIVDAGVEGRTQSETRKSVKPEVEKENVVQGKKEGDSSNILNGVTGTSSHRRTASRAEQTMEEDMKREAEKLNEMILEAEREKAEEEKRLSTPTMAEDSSDGTTQGAPTPSSSQSGRDREEEESMTSVEGSTSEDQPTTPNTQFTSFDQLVPNAPPTALVESPSRPLPRPQSGSLTLHNANILIHDDSVPGERTSIKAKPNFDYLIQIEPSSSAFPGWMIVRKYVDFETLHEVLKRIAVITGVPFNETHAELPKWKINTKAGLRTELERYLTDAVRFQPLAESEGMKRFLDKDQALSKSPNGSQKGFGWPTPDAFGKIGGDMFNVLTKAPKQVAGGVAGGGKAVFGGVAGLVGAGKKPSTSQTNLTRTTTNSSLDVKHHPGASIGQLSMTDSYSSSMSAGRASQDSLRTIPQSIQEERRGSAFSTASGEAKSRPSASPSRPGSIMSQNESAVPREPSPSRSTASLPPKDMSIDETIQLPPPPSEMPEDYDSPTSPGRNSIETFRSTNLSQRLSQSITREDQPPTPPRPQPTQSKAASQPKQPLTERETAVAVEIMFAVITQLYTLSGAWQIRRTLLTAAKTFLLRPGNPQLASIKDLLQTSLLESNLSDSGLAHHILKLRENGLPTEEEMEAWKRDYPEKTAEQKEELRIKARKLLVSKGMPQALTSVMGAAASGEALGKVFDALQTPEVSRGLIFGMMLQALRVVTQ